MSIFRKILICISIFVSTTMLFFVVFKPVLSNLYITVAKKYTRGQFVCTLDNQGQHVGQLYKVHNGEKQLIHTSISNSCIFSRPKINAGFFVFAIGGGGGATPYEGGMAGEIVSKHVKITNPVLVIKIGKGGKGTQYGEKTFYDAKDGEETTIADLKIAAQGGSKSTRMTPLGEPPKIANYHIPEKYHYLYDIPKSAKHGAGGMFNSRIKANKADADSGHSGAVIIQW